MVHKGNYSAYPREEAEGLALEGEGSSLDDLRLEHGCLSASAGSL